MNALKAIWFQLVVSKDATSPASYLYTFLADQSGHFTLGLAPVLLIYFLWPETAGSIQVMLYVLAFWVSKEIINFVMTYLQIKNDLWRVEVVVDLVLNVLVASVFFALGAVIAFSSYQDNLMCLSENTARYCADNRTYLIFYTSLTISSIVAVAWLYKFVLDKINIQVANLPLFCRVAMLDLKSMLYSDNSSNVLMLIEHETRTGTKTGSNRHTLIIGVAGSGKSLLATAIGSEACMLGRKVRYTTFSKLIEDTSTDLNTTNPDYTGKDLIIVDDFCPATITVDREDYVKLLTKAVPLWLFTNNDRIIFNVGDVTSFSTYWLTKFASIAAPVTFDAVLLKSSDSGN